MCAIFAMEVLISHWHRFVQWFVIRFGKVYLLEINFSIVGLTLLFGLYICVAHRILTLDLFSNLKLLMLMNSYTLSYFFFRFLLSLFRLVKWEFVYSKVILYVLFNVREQVAVVMFHLSKIPLPHMGVSWDSLDLCDLLVVQIHPGEYNFVIPSPYVIFVDKKTVGKPRHVVVSGFVFIQRIFWDNLFCSIGKESELKKEGSRYEIDKLLPLWLCV